MEKPPLQPVDDDARKLAQELLSRERTAAMGVILPENGAPYVSRIALALAPDGLPFTLMSTLALHTRALQHSPVCSLLVGTAPGKGDPLAFARITVSARAEFLDRAGTADLRRHYLETHPKSQLYVDFADFHFVRFHPIRAMLNGGFGRAYELTPDDLHKK